MAVELLEMECGRKASTVGIYQCLFRLRGKISYCNMIHLHGHYPNLSLRGVKSRHISVILA